MQVRHVFGIAGIVTMLGIPTAVPAQRTAALAALRYDADQQHSSIEFTARILRVIKVRGRFLDWSATVIYDPVRPERSSVTAVIVTKSITTDMSFRDDHLRSPDFLDVATYPTIVFQSDSVVPEPGGVLLTFGGLTMHGVTRAVAIPFTIVLPLEHEATYGTSRVAFEGSLRLSRADFGIAGTNKFNPSYDPATNLLADSLDISLEMSTQREGHLGPSFSPGPPPPVGETLWPIMERLGPDTALALYRSLRATQPQGFNYGPRQLDVLGHRLIERNRPRDAVKVLRFNADQHPEAGEYESLAEAYAFADDRAEALSAYQRVAQLDPTDACAREMIRRLSGP
ncbi:MAG TPA: YceI family protein [Gemmatimonadales bacterium]|jgi:polyisoprenoid-binding protein YceI|nr:YceI family protein [Gemmatimonadales bacterium]